MAKAKPKTKPKTRPKKYASQTPGPDYDGSTALLNPQHERLAQLLAEGHKQQAAGKMVGFKGRSTPGRLSQRREIKARVAWLLEQTQKEVAFTVADMVRQLDEDRKFAREHETAAAAVSASMGKAKVLGMLDERPQVNVNNNFSFAVKFVDPD